MKEKIAAYLDGVFMDLPVNEALEAEKQALVQQGEALYRDKIAEGLSARAAFDAVCDALPAMRQAYEESRSEPCREAMAQASAPLSEVPEEYIETPERELAGSVLSALSVIFYLVSVIPLLILQNNVGALILFPVCALAAAFALMARLAFPAPVYFTASDGVRRRYVPKESDAMRKNRQIRALLFSLGVALVIAAIDLPIIGDIVSPRVEGWFIAGMFLVDAVGVCLAIGSGRKKGHQARRFLLNDEEEKGRRFGHPVYRILLAATTLLYLTLSLLTMKWWITWLLWVALYCVFQAIHAIRRDD